MSHDAYSETGLYSHHGPSFQPDQTLQKSSSAAGFPPSGKKWKKPSSDSASLPALASSSALRKSGFSRGGSGGSGSSNSGSIGSSIICEEKEKSPLEASENICKSNSGSGLVSHLPHEKPLRNSECVHRSNSSLSSAVGESVFRTEPTARSKACESLPMMGGIQKSSSLDPAVVHTVLNVEMNIPKEAVSTIDETPSDTAGSPVHIPFLPKEPEHKENENVQPSSKQTLNREGSSLRRSCSGTSQVTVSVCPQASVLNSASAAASLTAPDALTVECGILGCRPSILQRLANIKVFVLLLSLLVTVQQAVASGYLNSVITTLEKRYEVPSYITGLISSMYEIGNVATVIFVSYLGSSRHIPVWIAVGCIVMGLGSLLFVGPQLFLESWSVEGSGALALNSSSMCTSATIHHQPIDQLPELGFPKLPRLGSSNKGDCVEEEAPSQLTPILLFMAGQLLLGAGGSPLLTLGTTYIDDHVKRQDSSLYIGIIYTMGAFGPVLGFLLGGYLLSFYVDTLFVSESLIKIDRTHPRWIGMWWAGFLLGSVALMALSVPFLMFPKKLVKEREKVRLAEKKSAESAKGHRRTKSETSTCSRVSRTSLASRRMYGKDVRDIPACLLKLVLNPIYFMTCLAACMELIIVSGFIVFLPKYLETQFSLSNVQASVFTGGVAIPGACVGTFLGGYILKRFSLRPKGAVQMLMVCNLFGLSLYGLFFVLGCDNVKMAGATSPYFSKSGGQAVAAELSSSTEAPLSLLSAFSSGTLPKISPNFDGIETPFTTSSIFTEGASSDFFMSSAPHSGSSEAGSGTPSPSFTVNLTSWCNTGCKCSHRLAEPVCGNNGLTYFSPCHAGCTAASPSSFTNCTCIDSAPYEASSQAFAEVVAVPVATAGPCYIPCNTFMPFMVVLFLMCASVATSQMPLLMIVLRSVSEEERALALGLQFVMYRLVAYIPAPIMFGSIIDSTCLMWTSSCGSGRCLMYDIEQFRYRYVGICAGIKVLAAGIFLLDWLLIRWQYRLDSAVTLTLGDLVASLRSVDRGGEEEDEFSAGNFRASGSAGAHHYTTSPSRCSSATGGFKGYYQATAGHSASTKHTGHKRSQSSCLASPPAWVGGQGGHRRSHSSSGAPPPGILNWPGHVRRPSAGYQVTFRDPSGEGGGAPRRGGGGVEDTSQLESLLPSLSPAERAPVDCDPRSFSVLPTDLSGSGGSSGGHDDPSGGDGSPSGDGSPTGDMNLSDNIRLNRNGSPSGDRGSSGDGSPTGHGIESGNHIPTAELGREN